MIWSSQVTTLITLSHVYRTRISGFLGFLLQIYADSWLENAANGLMGRQVIHTLLHVLHSIVYIDQKIIIKPIV